MSAYTGNNKRIARNMLFLYIRMAFILVVSLYSSRVVLNTLGVVDFGVFNVVAGFISLFAFLNSSLSSAIQRFYNYEEGKNGQEWLQKVYITSFLIQAILAAIVLILLETFGVWYLNHVLVVPPERMPAVHFLFQTSVISLILVVFEVPYSSIIMAKERMDYYAVVGIVDVLLKLGVAIMLPYLPYDKLITYSFLSLVITLTNFFLYFIYAKHNFPILKLKRHLDKELFRSMLSFSGWNVIGTFAFMLKGQGLNLLLNFFFGPVVNAARGISYQVLSAMQGFTANISIAFRPQLITSYAEGNIERTRKMMYSESKICYILIGALITPLIIEMDYVLHLWLGSIVPEYTVPFTILVLLDMLIGTLNTPFTQVVHATGNLKTYQIVSTIVHCLIIPIAWLFLKLGYSPVSSFVVCLAMAAVNQIGCMLVVRKIFPYGLKKYVVQIIFPCLLYTVLLPLLPLSICFVMEESFARLALICLVDLIAAITIAFFAVLNKDEKNLLLNFVRRS